MLEYLIKKFVDFANLTLGILYKEEFKKISKNKNVSLLTEAYRGDSYADSFLKTRFLDSPYIEIEKKIPRKSAVLDLGCGEGLFSNFLAASSSERKVIGIDIDKRRIKQANRGYKNARFVYGDVTKQKIDRVDTMIMFHLLHHLKSRAMQESFITKCLRKLDKGGTLFIVEIEPQYSYKYLLAFMVDHFLVPWLFEKRFYSNIYFRKAAEWKKILEKNDLKVITEDLSQNKPFSHVLIIGKK